MLKKAITAGKWTLNKPLIRQIQETKKGWDVMSQPLCTALSIILHLTV